MTQLFQDSISIHWPSVTTEDRKRFQCLKIVLNNKTDHYFWNSIDTKTRFSFLKTEQIA